MGLPFGRVTNILVLKGKNQAFLEMLDEACAAAMVACFNTNPPQVRGRTVYVQFSNHRELKIDQSHSVIVSKSFSSLDFYFLLYPDNDNTIDNTNKNMHNKIPKMSVQWVKASLFALEKKKIWSFFLSVIICAKIWEFLNHFFVSSILWLSCLFLSFFLSFILLFCFVFLKSSNCVALHHHLFCAIHEVLLFTFTIHSSCCFHFHSIRYNLVGWYSIRQSDSVDEHFHLFFY